MRLNIHIKIITPYKIFTLFYY